MFNYVFAVLGVFIGLLLGWRKNNKDDDYDWFFGISTILFLSITGSFGIQWIFVSLLEIFIGFLIGFVIFRKKDESN